MRNASASSSGLTTIYSLLLALGLFCVQVCQVVCTTVACASDVVPAQAPMTTEHAHCHSQPQSKAQTEPQTPKPHQHSHDCQQHAVLQSLLPDNQTAKQQAPSAWQPACSAPFTWVETSQLAAALSKPAPLPFKPPPRQQHSTIQRI